MAGRGGQPHPAGGVQQIQQLVLYTEGQIPVSGAEAVREGAAGKFALNRALNLVAQLLRRRGGTAVQGQSPGHVHALPPADEPVHPGPQCGAKQRRPLAALQVPLQIPAGEQQPAGQAHAPLLRYQVEDPPGPPGPGRLKQLAGTGLGQRPGRRIGPLRRAAHVAQSLVEA